jgi:PKD repeat protein
MTTLTVSAALTGAGDTTSPNLSSASASENGATAYTGSVATDEDNGTLYRYVSTNTTETAAQVISAGQSQAVSATGAQAVSGSGLSETTTYYLHFVHVDAAGNESAVLSTSAFTTAALGSGTGTVTLNLARATSPAVAPHGVHYTVNVTGASVSEPGSLNDFDPTHQGLVYITDWGDPGAASDKVVNVPAVWNDLNKSYGKHPAHVYTSPGNYTVTTTVYELDGTLVGTDTDTVTVGNPDTLFTGNRTILVDTEGDGDSDTYPSSQVVTTYAAAETAAKALNPQTCRILLRRGQTHNVTNRIIPKDEVANWYTGAFGTGARPILNLPVSNSINAGGANAPQPLFDLGDSHDRSFVLTDIDIQGPWDPVNETGGHYRCVSSTYVGNNRRILFNNVNAAGWSWTIGTTTGSSGNFGVWLYNSDITDWGDYGIWMAQNDNQYLAFIGSAIHQNANARMNGETKAWVKNQHGPIRLTSAVRCHMDVLDLFSRNGWTSNSGDFGRMPTSQPCIRFVTDGDSQVRQPHITVSRAALEGGYSIVQLKHMNGNVNGTLTAANALFDKCLLVGTVCTWHAFEVQYSGFTVRNTVVVIPDVRTKNDRWKGIFKDFGFNDGPRDNADPTRIHNNTYVTLKSVANLDGDATNIDESITAVSTDYARANDAAYQPNGGSNHEEIDVDLSTALTTVGGTWTSRFTGGIVWTAGGLLSNQPQDLTWNSPAGFVTTMIPNASSPLVGDATGALQAYDDFYGDVRTGSDRGAIER